MILVRLSGTQENQYVFAGGGTSEQQRERDREDILREASLNEPRRGGAFQPMQLSLCFSNIVFWLRMSISHFLIISWSLLDVISWLIFLDL